MTDEDLDRIKTQIQLDALQAFSELFDDIHNEYLGMVIIPMEQMRLIDLVKRTIRRKLDGLQRHLERMQR